MALAVYKKSEFARLAGVSRAAVTKAVRAGYIVEIDGKIDITNPKNAMYLSTNRDKRPHVAKSKLPDGQKSRKIHRRKSKTIDEEEPKPERKQKINKISRQKQFEEWASLTDTTKEAADIRRINALTSNLRLKYAERLKILVQREMVERVFQNIYAVAINYFLVLGDRMAPILASLCGVSDQKIIIEMKDRIDKEVTQALDELKRQTEVDL